MESVATISTAAKATGQGSLEAPRRAMDILDFRWRYQRVYRNVNPGVWLVRRPSGLRCMEPSSRHEVGRSTEVFNWGSSGLEAGSAL